MKAVKTIAAINAVIEALQERDHRTHLGASVIREKCSRQIWYIFRWAKKESFIGRMLRLFSRGHETEFGFVSLLRSIGCEVWDVNPKTGKQFRILGWRGHFGGSCDAVIRGIPDMPTVPMLGEFKTANDKWFKKLEKEGLCSCYPKHFDQMQTYMRKLGLTHALYCCTNKNDDDLYFEIVALNEQYADRLFLKAKDVIESIIPPARITKEKGYFCKFCNFSGICWDGDTPEKNCRTCEHVQVCDEGKWSCKFHRKFIDENLMKKGCSDYRLNHGMAANL